MNNKIIDIALSITLHNQPLENVLSFIQSLSERPTILPDTQAYDDVILQSVYTRSMGLYTHKYDAIIINQFLIDQYRHMQYKDYGNVLLHELAHWTGRHTRLDRTFKGHLLIDSNIHYHTEEVIAELTACKLGVMLGYDAYKLEMEFNNYARNFPGADLSKAGDESDRAIEFLNSLTQTNTKAA